MLTDADNARFDSIMNKVVQRREDRGDNTPERDEERIAQILGNAERRAALEHALWLESKERFASAVKYQPAAVDSDEVKEFSNIDRWRNFSEEDA